MSSNETVDLTGLGMVEDVSRNVLDTPGGHFIGKKVFTFRIFGFLRQASVRHPPSMKRLYI